VQLSVRFCSISYVDMLFSWYWYWCCIFVCLKLIRAALANYAAVIYDFGDPNPLFG
jgi:hypothetical protein